MNAEQIAQWVIDNRYPKSETNKTSDFEMYHFILDAITEALTVGNKEREALRKELEALRADNKRLREGMKMGTLRNLINAYLKEEISLSKFLEVVNGKSNL